MILRKKAADTGSLLTHFIRFSFRSIIYEANGEELYNSRVERLLAEYLIDTLLKSLKSFSRHAIYLFNY